MSLFDIFDNNAQTQAAGAQTAGINAGYSALSNLYGQGQNALTTNYAAGLQPFQTNYNNAQAGVTQYGNALGLNGPQGSAAATAAFQANPGYNFQLNQGTQNVLRNQSATGALASGATDTALNNYAQGQANQGWTSYLSALQPYLNQSNAAATGIGTLDSGLGTNLANSFNTQGNAAYGAQTSIGNANANADLGNLNASANTLGALTGAAGMGAQLFGFFSDRRVKDDIEPVGKLFDGQDVYRFRYKGDHRHQIGLMAQDVEEREPEAVREFGGVKVVDYGRATDFAATLMRLAA